MDVCLRSVVISATTLVSVPVSLICVCKSLEFCCTHEATLSSVMRTTLVYSSHLTRIRSFCMSGAENLSPRVTTQLLIHVEQSTNTSICQMRPMKNVRASRHRVLPALLPLPHLCSHETGIATQALPGCFGGPNLLSP